MFAAGARGPVLPQLWTGLLGLETEDLICGLQQLGEKLLQTVCLAKLQAGHGLRLRFPGMTVSNPGTAKQGPHISGLPRSSPRLSLLEQMNFKQGMFSPCSCLLID